MPELSAKVASPFECFGLDRTRAHQFPAMAPATQPIRRHTPVRMPTAIDTLSWRSGDWFPL